MGVSEMSDGRRVKSRGNADAHDHLITFDLSNFLTFSAFGNNTLCAVFGRSVAIDSHPSFECAALLAGPPLSDKLDTNADGLTFEWAALLEGHPPAALILEG